MGDVITSEIKPLANHHTNNDLRILPAFEREVRKLLLETTLESLFSISAFNVSHGDTSGQTQRNVNAPV